MILSNLYPAPETEVSRQLTGARQVPLSETSADVAYPFKTELKQERLAFKSTAFESKIPTLSSTTPGVPHSN